MNIAHRIRGIVLCVSVCLCSTPLISQIRLPRLVSDGMVLQRETPVNIWGWAAQGEKIRVTFNGKTYRTITGPNGRWNVTLAPMRAGGPYTMQVRGNNRKTGLASLLVKDILVGDVWICAGQSNMVLPMERVKEKYPEVIAQAHDSAIRQFFVVASPDFNSPHDDLPGGKWEPSTPSSVLQFSATAYFFAKALYDKYHVPIGLINASVGGTPIESWISEEGLLAFPEDIQLAHRARDTAYVNAVNRNALASAAESNRLVKERDMGLTGPKPWYDTTYEPWGWDPISIPGYWADEGVKGLNGVVWYRKDVDIPASMTGVSANIFMGRIVDADYLYVNGVLVGSTTYQYPPRRYVLPAGLLRPGRNRFVIKVVNYTGKGGFVPGKAYHLEAGGQDIDLRGDWQYKVGEAFAPVQGGVNINWSYQPIGLYNAMIAPLTLSTVKGYLWYQGEANTGNPSEYQRLLPALIANWRKQWGLGELPFLYVQLPNFMETQYLPSESNWAELRAAQSSALSVPHTGMAVAIDLGEWNDIHPLDKKDVGERLAYAAEKVAYGDEQMVFSGPTCENARTEDHKIILSFSHTGTGLMAKGDADLHYFSIAGADRKFVWAQAQIEGNTVTVWSRDILQPVYVRYAWADNPEGANLFNKEGLPASPFEIKSVK